MGLIQPVPFSSFVTFACLCFSWLDLEVPSMSFLKIRFILATNFHPSKSLQCDRMVQASWHCDNDNNSWLWYSMHKYFIVVPHKSTDLLVDQILGLQRIADQIFHFRLFLVASQTALQWLLSYVYDRTVTFVIFWQHNRNSNTDLHCSFLMVILERVRHRDTAL